MKKNIFILFILFFNTCINAKEIRLGVALPLTGSVAAYGQDILSGIEVASKLNSRLSNGDEIKIILVDTKGDKLETSNGLNRLISQDKVLGLIGEATTPNTIQAISIAEDKKIPIIAPVASGDKLLNKKQYASRVCFKDSFQGEKFASYVTNELNLKNVVIIIDQGNIYSLGLAKAFEKAFKEHGGKVIKKLIINSGDKDFRAIASQLKSLNPDFVYMPIYHPEAALIARQAKQIGFNKILTAGDGVANQTFIKLGGNSVDGVIFTDSFDFNNPTTELGKKFILAYEKEKGTKEVPAFSAMGADAYFVMVNAMNECIDNLNTECINNKIHQTKEFQGVSGIISIDESGNAIRSVVIKEIKNQKQVYKTSINP
ncbi:branched-chain amino acid ABC transporter substrate-binding protein [Campylobacter novaezeelandiae]|uniref:Branched-chain amino acid ABC transporter substrate-binding protein n=1 Tax=Campylobacter novaezeelandiae TaxID=2267891 RepID=A0A4Q9JVS8_9BACT|nr:ABC transporter substrate-binding protein [Campylobacter novaezeelandiae]QWU80109.1 high-affinity branched-chain amino acid transporter, periplasmic Leu/Ile/Val-binding protein [Campylobacter novaezeelandiae]TBR78975.1 branched-chain amino acid ABC transporter substrate-binding protein [Campylobacter novaezeelandiae]TBR81574.1 branched-chain amino acid ABC transporter substrate-binding protein [Campylobacter novaezeelandiae]TBR82317.1 branched-chain amino acid ABC transporter substrate-bindi